MVGRENFYKLINIKKLIFNFLNKIYKKSIKSFLMNSENHFFEKDFQPDENHIRIVQNQQFGTSIKEDDYSNQNSFKNLPSMINLQSIGQAEEIKIYDPSLSSENIESQKVSNQFSNQIDTVSQEFEPNFNLSKHTIKLTNEEQKNSQTSENFISYPGRQIQEFQIITKKFVGRLSSKNVFESPINRNTLNNNENPENIFLEVSNSNNSSSKENNFFLGHNTSELEMNSYNSNLLFHDLYHVNSSPISHISSEITQNLKTSIPSINTNTPALFNNNLNKQANVILDVTAIQINDQLHSLEENPSPLEEAMENPFPQTFNQDRNMLAIETSSNTLGSRNNEMQDIDQNDIILTETNPFGEIFENSPIQEGQLQISQDVEVNIMGDTDTQNNNEEPYELRFCSYNSQEENLLIHNIQNLTIKGEYLIN